MEAEVAAMLRSAGLESGQAVQRGEDALALKVQCCGRHGTQSLCNRTPVKSSY